MTPPQTEQSGDTRLGLLIGGAVLGVLITGGAALALVTALRPDPPAEAAAAPVLEQLEDAGIDQVYDGEFEFFVGGGVAAFDCNADGLPDLYLPGGSGTAGLYVNQSDPGGVISFDRLASPVTDLESVTGAYPIDVDSDGILDLAVLRVGENAMLRGQGSCQFEPANALWGVDGGSDWTAAFTAQWEADQSLPTMVFGNYLVMEPDGTHDTCADHRLLRPEGDGYSAPLSLGPGWCALSVLFSDWSRTGSRDLRATNDRHYYRDGEEQLWRVASGTDPVAYTSQDGWKTMQIWGMGIASQDLTGDGLPEVFLTSQGDNKLQTLESGPDQPSYVDMALSVGATAHRPYTGDVSRPSTAWHAEFDDMNNDGYLDLFVTKGNVEAMPEFAQEDPNNLLLGQPDGTFREGAQDAGLLDFSRSRGAALVDLNLDGALDAIVVERREPVKIWQGTARDATGSALGHWIQLRLSQNAPNVDGIGAWIEVRHSGRVVEREVTIGGGHSGGELGWIHFGLGTDTTAEVRVTWPDGDRSGWIDVDADGFVVIDRSSGAHAWSPLRD